MRLIDGRAIAAAIDIGAGAADRAPVLAPVLAALMPTDDEAARWYQRSIERVAAKVGITVRVETLIGADRPMITDRLDALSADPGVHGIICQTPLPTGVSLQDVGAHIAVGKDVDGANPVSLGRLAAGLPAFAPATAAAVVEILRREQVPLAGTRAVVVGRSVVVGKPVALLLLAENATVTVCHSRTVGLAEVCAEADVLVAAVGRAGLIGAGHIKPGAVVIDVGTNPGPGGGLVGDVDAAGADAAAALTPVPGGVGPVTTMVLMRQVARAAVTCRTT
jgi:methylenetetrahydrofolate dehydrogenase (NADP+)/methenyltetrahydrofolate cyclohydrolase